MKNQKVDIQLFFKIALRDICGRYRVTLNRSENTIDISSLPPPHLLYFPGVPHAQRQTIPMQLHDQGLCVHDSSFIVFSSAIASSSTDYAVCCLLWSVWDFIVKD